MMSIPTLKSLDLTQKRLLIREDFNVPFDEQGQITHDARIQEALPTIQHALSKQAAVILMSHLGRPEEGHFDAKYSLKPVAEVLSERLGQTVRLADWQDKTIECAPGEVVLLENVRFMSGEKSNDPALAQWLAGLCDVFVMDAFAVAHRAQASTVGVAEHAPQVCAGLLLDKELRALTQAFKEPERPWMAVVGGSKVSTKFKVLEKLLEKVDVLVVGGGMANTFLKAQGYPIGASLYEEAWIDKAKALIKKAQDTDTLVLPLDVVVAQDINAPKGTHKELDQVGPDDQIFDVGPKTTAHIMTLLQKAKTIVWNGPLGVFEKVPFAQGTHEVGQAIARCGAYSLAGGGDTLAAIEQFSLGEGISYQSTAGGAFLEFLEGETLPALAALEKRTLKEQAR